jgi:quercetin dioxygenase-like cupin family protein
MTNDKGPMSIESRPSFPTGNTARSRTFFPGAGAFPGHWSFVLGHFPDMSSRTFNAEQHVRFSSEKATVTEVSLTSHASIAVWGVRPGQEVPAHTHPDGQDTWVMVKGELTYYLGNGQRRTIRAGDVDVADKNEVHGAINEAVGDAVFLSIYSAPKIGWEKAQP